MAVVNELLKAAGKAIGQAADSFVEHSKNPREVLNALADIEIAKELGKEAGIVRTNRFGDLYLKLPLFKTKEELINQAFSKHPERSKVCFHFSGSIRNGVTFLDPDGNIAFIIHPGEHNLRHLELYQGSRFVGRIQKVVTINLNPLADRQKYHALVHSSTGTITVSWFTSSSDISTWHMSHKIGSDFIIERPDGLEIARFYALGSSFFVFDYDPTVDPAEMILSFMAIKIKAEEQKENQHLAYRGGPLGKIISEIKDIF